MHLVQILLPVLEAEKGSAGDVYGATRHELAKAFGGITTYTRSPAKGLWRDEGGEMQRDDIVVFEVMVEELDRAWWKEYRAILEGRFSQDEIVIRALAVLML